MYAALTCSGLGMPGRAPLTASDSSRATLGSPPGRPQDAATSIAPSRGSPSVPSGSTCCAALCAYRRVEASSQERAACSGMLGHVTLDRIYRASSQMQGSEKL